MLVEACICLRVFMHRWAIIKEQLFSLYASPLVTFTRRNLTVQVSLEGMIAMRPIRLVYDSESRAKAPS